MQLIAKLCIVQLLAKMWRLLVLAHDLREVLLAGVCSMQLFEGVCRLQLLAEVVHSAAVLYTSAFMNVQFTTELCSSAGSREKSSAACRLKRKYLQGCGECSYLHGCTADLEKDFFYTSKV